jgi:hypothetical protein
MILWFGEENDVLRHAKIAWLRTHFNEPGIEIPMHSLRVGDLAENRTWYEKTFGSKEKLIISGHANNQVFMDRTARELYTFLRDRGLNTDRWDTIYLLGCDIGNQEPSTQQSFLRDFGQLVKIGIGAALKVKGPCGTIVWTYETTDRGIYKVHRMTDVRIIKYAPDGVTELENHSFDAGLRLYSM